MSKRHTVQGATAVLLLAQSFLACTRWEVQELAPQQVIEAKRPERVRVSTVEDSRIVLQTPIRVVEDTLTGWMPERGYARLVTLPLDSVKTVEVRRARPVASAALIVGSLVAVLGVWVGLSASGG